MESLAAPGLHQAWIEKKLKLKEEHEKVLQFLDNLFEKKKQDLREQNEIDLQKLKATVPLSLYQDLVSPMAGKALNYDLLQEENNYKKQLELTQNSHRKECARQEVSYQEKLKVNLAQAQTRQSPPTIQDNGIAQHQNVSTGPNDSDRRHQQVLSNPVAFPSAVQQPKLTKPLVCTIQHEIIDGKQRLMMHVRSLPKKRKASESEDLPPKRPHLDTSLDACANSLRTPVSTPRSESSLQPEKTITFDEVYQNGNARDKHTIVEWPINTGNWYILKCDQHGLHFTQNPIAGAARHLTSPCHGIIDRSWYTAVKVLGCRVLGCNEAQVRSHNEIVDKAYANGYVPVGFRGSIENLRQKHRKVPTVVSTSQTTNLSPVPAKGTTPEKRPTENGGGITDPKWFHIYYGKWKDDKNKKPETYPVMILGWDDQKGSGLEDYDLHDTGLLKKTSHPPSCYQYDSRRIIGWAPGYEDGGPKVELRKFPVMFFDESQTVAWFRAADLSIFPLYKRNVSDKPDDPINAARRWIAEREGFDTWEEREKSRLEGSETRLQSCYSRTSVEGSPGNPNGLADNDDSGSESEAASTSSTETERLLKKLRETGGEIAGDDDYSASGSDLIDYLIDGKEVDDNLDFETEQWNRTISSNEMMDSVNNRPWTFYQLRKKDANETDEVADSQETHEVQESSSMTVKPIGMESARKLAIQACQSPSNRSLSTDSQSRHENPAPDANSQKEGVTSVMRGGDESERPAFSADGDTHVSSYHQQQTEREVEGERDQEKMTSMNNQVSELPSSRVSLPPPGYSAVDGKEALNNREDIPSTAPINADARIIGGPSIGNTEGVLDKETTETITRTASCPPQTVALDAASTALAASIKDMADAKPDYELSLFSDEVTCWKASNKDDDYIQLFCSSDRKRVATIRGSISVMVDPMEVVSFFRDQGALVLKRKRETSLRVVFDRNNQSKLDIGKIQTRGFIRWLRSVNADIICSES